MASLFATVADMWRLATPPDSLFQDQSLAPGTWSSIVKSGTGSGLMSLGNESSPIGDFSVVVKVVVGGELNVYGVVNPGVVPNFSISLDGGLSYGPPNIPNDNGTIKYIHGGFTLRFVNATNPSFVVGDTFSFTTTPSPDVTGFLAVAAERVEGFVRNTYQPPYASWGDDVRLAICELARWYLIKKRGIDKSQEFAVYEPKDTMEWLRDVSKGYIQPSIVEIGREKLYPNIMILRKPFSTNWDF